MGGPSTFFSLILILYIAKNSTAQSVEQSVQNFQSKNQGTFGTARPFSGPADVNCWGELLGETRTIKPVPGGQESAGAYRSAGETVQL